MLCGIIKAREEVGASPSDLENSWEWQWHMSVAVNLSVSFSLQEILVVFLVELFRFDLFLSKIKPFVIWPSGTSEAVIMQLSARHLITTRIANSRVLYIFQLLWRVNKALKCTCV